jgi:fructosamine-3-kinase
MTLPATLQSTLEQTLAARIVDTAQVGGGCISKTACLALANGERAFLKWARAQEHTPGLFRAEAQSLRAIAHTNTVRVPEVLHVDDASAEYSFLLLEWLQPGAATTKGWTALGTNLANLHQHRADKFGWSNDNFIGSLPQSNRMNEKWPDFWRAERILPQLEVAPGRFRTRDRERFDKLLEALDDLLWVADQEGASLLHGDLWNGNVHMLDNGAAAVIDPSSYYGHREVDLAMSKLFGGFTRNFYEAYQRAWPLEQGSEQRLLVYQLYYLLVHVNLFGASYVPNTMAVLERLGF